MDSNLSLTAVTPTVPKTLRGLDCEIGAAVVVVPTEFVDRVIETPLSGPVPASLPVVVGLGQWLDEPVVALGFGLLDSAHRVYRILLLRHEGHEGFEGARVGLVVTRVRGFVEVLLTDEAVGATPPASYFLRCRASDGTSTRVLDVARLLRGAGSVR